MVDGETGTEQTPAEAREELRRVISGPPRRVTPSRVTPRQFRRRFEEAQEELRAREEAEEQRVFEEQRRRGEELAEKLERERQVEQRREIEAARTEQRRFVERERREEVREAVTPTELEEARATLRGFITPREEVPREEVVVPEFLREAFRPKEAPRREPVLEAPSVSELITGEKRFFVPDIPKEFEEAILAEGGPEAFAGFRRGPLREVRVGEARLRAIEGLPIFTGKIEPAPPPEPLIPTDVRIPEVVSPRLEALLTPDPRFAEQRRLLEPSKEFAESLLLAGGAGRIVRGGLAGARAISPLLGRGVTVGLGGLGAVTIGGEAISIAREPEPIIKARRAVTLAGELAVFGTAFTGRVEPFPQPRPRIPRVKLPSLGPAKLTVTRVSRVITRAPEVIRREGGLFERPRVTERVRLAAEKARERELRKLFREEEKAAEGLELLFRKPTAPPLPEVTILRPAEVTRPGKIERVPRAIREFAEIVGEEGARVELGRGEFQFRTTISRQKFEGLTRLQQKKVLRALKGELLVTVEGKRVKTSAIQPEKELTSIRKVLTGAGFEVTPIRRISRIGLEAFLLEEAAGIPGGPRGVQRQIGRALEREGLAFAKAAREARGQFFEFRAPRVGEIPTQRLIVGRAGLTRRQALEQARALLGTPAEITAERVQQIPFLSFAGIGEAVTPLEFAREQEILDLELVRLQQEPLLGVLSASALVEGVAELTAPISVEAPAQVTPFRTTELGKITPITTQVVTEVTPFIPTPTKPKPRPREPVVPVVVIPDPIIPRFEPEPEPEPRPKPRPDDKVPRPVVVTLPGLPSIDAKPPKKERKGFRINFLGPRGGPVGEEDLLFGTERLAKKFAGFIVDVGPETGFRVRKDVGVIREPDLDPRVKAFSFRRAKFVEESPGVFIEKRQFRRDSIGERVDRPLTFFGGLRRLGGIPLISRRFGIGGRQREPRVEAGVVVGGMDTLLGVNQGQKKKNGGRGRSNLTTRLFG